MTREDFLRVLEHTSLHIDWHISPFGNIRAEGRKTGHYFCPLTAVHWWLTGEYFPTSYALVLTTTQKLPYSLPNQIIDAADNMLVEDTELQYDILRACGIFC